MKNQGLQVKQINETIQNEAKEKKDGFPRMLLRILAASLLGSALTGRGVIAAGEVIIRAGQCRLIINLMVFIQEIIYPKLRMDHI